jgi:hypothetical protein
MAGAVEMARKAWPDLSAHLAATMIEELPEWGLDPFKDMNRWGSWIRLRSYGRVLPIHESVLTSTLEMDSADLAAQLLAAELSRKRPVMPEQAGVFRQLLRQFTVRRLGTTQKVTAALSAGDPSTTPILEMPDWELGWCERLPAVLGEVERRVGQHALQEGFAEFLNAKGERRGTVKELLDRIGRISGVSLERIYSDYFTGRALPVLTLDDVHFRKTATEWDVTGSVKNLASGEAICPVVLRTDLGSESVDVTVDGGKSTPFRISTSARPASLMLDPDGVCYRFQRVGIVQLVPFKGES